EPLREPSPLSQATARDAHQHLVDRRRQTPQAPHLESQAAPEVTTSEGQQEQQQQQQQVEQEDQQPQELQQELD
ncbi:hypothetical protein, partial [Clostridioides difficile]|uniref:hypothetical protein n=1 Tax=Clostridioides difficile TaxID=1496 RepID=UPI00197CB290